LLLFLKTASGKRVATILANLVKSGILQAISRKPPLA
jgi:hypothetical protein